jgi:type IV pilus assembly protein PilA
MVKKGFTLVEMLLVVIIIAILTTIVLVALNPARQLALTNNTKRSADVNVILNAVSEFMIENDGDLPVSEESNLNVIQKNMGITSSDVDICDELVPDFIAEIPFDSTQDNAYFISCNDYNAEYTISADSDGRVTVESPHAQLFADISVTR